LATPREIRRRILTIGNLGQVTRALQAVAASKARRARDAAQATRPYSHAAWEFIVDLSAASKPKAETHPLLSRREPVRQVAIVLISGERGLCGAYNHNVVHTAIDFAEKLGVPVRYITVGRRGHDFLWRSGRQIVARFQGMPAVPGIADVRPIARAAMDEFLEERADEVYLARTDFVNLLTHRPVVQRLLPLVPTELDTQVMAEYVVETAPSPVREYIFEPDAATILNEVLPRFTELQVWQAIRESEASEHAARMVAMRNATENAAALADELTLDYNKARQQSITSELLDIAGGAEALAQASEWR
jgi:F-type H+-transporting ATPase subunit gamma